MSHTTRDADNNLIHSRDYPIVLPNGPDRTPAPMEFTTKPTKNVGIWTANGIEYQTTDDSRTRTINVFTKKATAQGGTLYPEVVKARLVINTGTNFFKMRVTIADADNSRTLDRAAQREDVAAGYAHHTRPSSVYAMHRRAPTAQAYPTTKPRRAQPLQTTSCAHSTSPQVSHGATRSRHTWQNSCGSAATTTTSHSRSHRPPRAARTQWS